MKVLIVTDQILTQFKLVEQLQSHLEIQNSDIRIANNGLEAIKVAEQNNLDIILIDLQMLVMDGLTAIKRMVDKYPEIKIIVITSFDDQILLQKSIDAGAKGYLLKEDITTNLIPLMQNVINGYTAFPEKKINSNNLSLDSDSIILLEGSDKILKINKIVAAEVINHWTYDRVDNNLTEASFFEFFKINLKVKEELTNFISQGTSPRCNLVEELQLRLEHLASERLVSRLLTKDNLESELELIINQLNYWFYTEQLNNNFSCFHERLQANAQILRISMAKQLKKFINSFLLKISPMPCLEYLELLEILLKDTAKEYQNELKNFSAQEQSAWQSYNILININSKSVLDNNEIKERNSLICALSYIYHAKISIEIYSLAVQTLEGMVRIIQFYIDDLILTNNLLENIQNNLDVFDVDRSISLFIENKFNSFQDSMNLLQEIEDNLGYPINQWGILCHINPNLILDMLIAKISTSSNDILESINQELYV